MGYSVSDTSTKTSTQGAQTYGGIYLGGGGGEQAGTFMSTFWAANPGQNANPFVQGLASIPTWGWIAGAAVAVVIGVLLIKRG